MEMPSTDVLAERIEAIDRVTHERDRRYSERFDAQEKAVAAALAAAKEAVARALEAQHDHDQAHNGLVEEMRSNTAHYATRREHDVLATQIGDQAKLIAAMAGSSKTTWALVGLLVGVIAALGAAYVGKR